MLLFTTKFFFRFLGFEQIQIATCKSVSANFDKVGKYMAEFRKTALLSPLLTALRKTKTKTKSVPIFFCSVYSHFCQFKRQRFISKYAKFTLKLFFYSNILQIKNNFRHTSLNICCCFRTQEVLRKTNYYIHDGYGHPQGRSH